MSSKTMEGIRKQTIEDARAEFERRLKRQQREYSKALEILTQAATTLTAECLSRARAKGVDNIRAEWRVKDWDQLRKKLEDGRAKAWDLCSDLVGVKLVILSTDLLDWVLEAESDLRLPGRQSRRMWHSTKGRSRGYSAVHVQIGIPEPIAVPGRVRQVGAELQILTEFQQVWDTLTHDDFYKSPQGVPSNARNRVLRLAAAVDLLDHEMKSVREELEPLRVSTEEALSRAHAEGNREWESVLLDEASLMAASERQLRGTFDGLRTIAVESGWRRSIWPEPVRLGSETDLFFTLCDEAGIRVLGELDEVAARAPQWRGAMSNVAERVFALEGDDYSLFDRPLFVLAMVILLENPGALGSVFHPVIDQEIAREALQHPATGLRSGTGKTTPKGAR